MEWCIACHREPEKSLRPKSEVFSMTYNPADTVGGKPAVWLREDFPHMGRLGDGYINRRSASRGNEPEGTRLALEGPVQGPRCRHTHELLDVPPVVRRRAVIDEEWEHSPHESGPRMQ